MVKILPVSQENFEDLRTFITDLDESSLRSFRYFRHRSFDILNNHITTLLLYVDHTPVGYGHLDQEGEVIWLGIAINSKYQRQGLGDLLMKTLFLEAGKNNIPIIHLTVDKVNEKAIYLYKKHGFEVEEEFDNYIRMLKKIHMSIAVSSLAFQGYDIHEVANAAKKNNLVVEFSSGLPYDSGQIEVLKNMPPHEFYIHNYFPIPSEPFVLNLASSNKGIRKRSEDHCINNLRLCEELGLPFFSAHAGFCIDPDPNKLGSELGPFFEFDREEHMAIFQDSLNNILRVANECGVTFLVENNVLAPFNYHSKNYPLLCCDPKEICELIKIMGQEKLGILFDTGHWKVSSRTLGFELSELSDFKEHIMCVHHSDNDGFKDSNELINFHKYWFTPFMSELPSCQLHVLEVKKLAENQIFDQLKGLRNLLI